MKIKPLIYAKTLVESAGANNQQIAKRFWYALQKNKQYKDLPKILDLFDQEAAIKENKKLVLIYSKNSLDTSSLLEIERKFQNKLNFPIILKNIIGKNITGLIARTDDQYIDLTLENKVKRLSRILN